MKWNVFISTALLTLLVSCLKPPSSTTPDDNNTTDDNNQSTTPNTVTTHENITADFQYVIHNNGATPTTSNATATGKFKSKLKEKGHQTLLAATNVTTKWVIELQNKNSKPFLSKIVASNVEGEGLKSTKSGTHGHTYTMENLFIDAGNTNITFKMVPTEACQIKYSSNTNLCTTIDSAPSDVTAEITVPIEVIDTGVKSTTDSTTCSFIQAGGNILSILTGQSAMGQLLGKTARDIIAASNSCQISP